MTAAPSETPRRATSRRAAVRAGVVVSAFVVLSAVPYVVAAARTPPGAEFSGLILNYPDQHWYLTVQRSVAAGLDRQNRYTTEEGAPVLVSPLYVAVGAVQRLFHLPLLFTYHAFRVLLALSLPALAYWCFRAAFPTETWTVTWATLLALFNVGAGTLFGYLPISLAARATDWNVPESNSLITAAVFPHITLALTGVLVLLGSLLLATRDASVSRVALVAGAGSLMVSASHPFLLAPFFLAAAFLVTGNAAAAALGRQTFGPALRLAAASAAAAVVTTPFVLVLLDQNRHFQRVEGRSYPVTESGAWWTWLSGYGILVPLALIGFTAAVAYRHRMASVAVLTTWIACQVPLLYGFTNFERRFSEGLAFPIAGLAGLGVASLRSRLRLSPQKATAFLVAFLLPASIVAAGRLGFTGMYISKDYREAFDHLGRDDIVLAGDYASMILPGQTDATTLVGRDILTVAWPRKAEERRRFSVDPTSAESLGWLERGGVTAVLVDSADPTLAIAPERLAQPCFSKALSAGRVSLYRVNRTCEALRGGRRRSPSSAGRQGANPAIWPPA